MNDLERIQLTTDKEKNLRKSMYRLERLVKQQEEVLKKRKKDFIFKYMKPNYTYTLVEEEWKLQTFYIETLPQKNWMHNGDNWGKDLASLVRANTEVRTGCRGITELFELFTKTSEYQQIIREAKINTYIDEI